MQCNKYGVGSLFPACCEDCLCRQCKIVCQQHLKCCYPEYDCVIDRCDDFVAKNNNERV